MFELAEMYVYPVKGCRGIAVQRWELDRFGLRFDRAFMVVDAAGRFVTQREEPRLARVRTALEPISRGVQAASALLLEVDGYGALRVPLHPEAGMGVRAQAEVWRFRGEVVDQGED